MLSRTPDIVDYLSLVWEIPLAAGSMLLYRIMRVIFSRLYRLTLSRKREDELQWRVLSADTFENVKFALPVMMTTGPRWNTHAVIGTLGPFRVADSLELEMAAIQRSAQSWVAVVYAFPSFETVASLDSHQFRQDVSETEPWVSIDVPPGRYTLGVRYYDRAPQIIYPQVHLDPASNPRILQGFEADPATNEFYHQLKDYPRKGFYLALHYYTYVLLKYRKHLPEAWVQREYLPVGAPDTKFFYGGLNAGEVMEIELEPGLLEQYDFYLSLYDWSSFPMAWQPIEQPSTKQPVPHNGSYAFRVRPKRATASGVWPSWTEERRPEQSGVGVRFGAIA